MKQLSSTLVEWQDEVVRVQNVYHSKVEKAKEVIIKVFSKISKQKKVEGIEHYLRICFQLKEENAMLKQRIDLIGNNTCSSLNVPGVVRPIHAQVGNKFFLLILTFFF